jgi:hypothetical protein
MSREADAIATAVTVRERQSLDPSAAREASRLRGNDYEATTERSGKSVPIYVYSGRFLKRSISMDQTWLKLQNGSDVRGVVLDGVASDFLNRQSGVFKKRFNPFKMDLFHKFFDGEAVAFLELMRGFGKQFIFWNCRQALQ